MEIREFRKTDFAFLCVCEKETRDFNSDDREKQREHGH